MAEKRILVCEDEDAIRDFVVINLRRAGYQVVDVNSGEKAIEAFEQCGGDFDVALLDIMMPGIDGIEVCKKLRESSPFLGIIMLSAKSQEMDKVTGLMTGADDYVTKPFSPSELVARVDAIYRRVSAMPKAKTKGQEQTVVSAGPFSVDFRSRIVTKNATPIELTQVEYQLLEFFLKNIGTALDRKTLLHKIWGENYYGDDKIVDVNIRRLRMKIEDDPSAPRYIQTIWGYGYKWDD